MIDKEKILKRDKVKYLKSKFISRQADLCITTEELVLQSNTTEIKGFSLLNNALRLNPIKKSKRLIIPIKNIKSVNFLPKDNIIEFVDNNGKDFRIEFQKAEDWIAMINSKIRIINN